MNNPLARLFRRYRHHHLTVKIRPRALRDMGGDLIGYLDRGVLRAGRVELEGWGLGVDVSLLDGDRQETRATVLARGDVEARLGTGKTRGFRVATRWSGVAWLRLSSDAAVREYTLRGPALRHRLVGELRVALGFVGCCLRAVPALLSWRRLPSPQARLRLKRAFKLDEDSTGPVFDGRFFASSRTDPRIGSFVIILPAYNAADLLAETLRRISDNTRGDWRAIVIDDASTDPRVRDILAKWGAAHKARVTLLRNSRNLGFVATVNCGFAHLGPDQSDVVLLNADAWVPPGWDMRLRAPLADRTVASVTPMSNNAELLSVRGICQAAEAQPGLAERLDQAAAQLSAAPSVTLPTGVGFCMALSAHWLARVPAFDASFGRGYGEEVDWCQRVRAMGGRHVAQHRLFVEHAGAASFGAERNALVASAGAEIARRYPRFDAEVQTFIREDPLATARAYLAVAWLDATATRAVPVYLAHSMGGGAEIALQREIAASLHLVGGAVILRVGGERRFQIEVRSKQGATKIGADAFSDVVRILGPLTRRRVIYSCGVGDPDPIRLPGWLMELAKGGSLAFRVHDYFCISPSVVLLDGDGCPRGVAKPGQEGHGDTCTRPDGSRVGLSAWRSAWGAALARADEIRVFSNSSRTLLLDAYPGITDRITVKPHSGFPVPQAVRGPRAPVPAAVGVLGNLNAAKGAGVLCDLARQSLDRPLSKFLHFGEMDPSFSVPSNLRSMGPYNLAEVHNLALRHGVVAWFMPSICPETFSFTTHEMLSTGLPVVGLNIGAQGAALRAHPNGHSVDLLPDGRPDIAQCLAVLDALTRRDGVTALDRAA